MADDEDDWGSGSRADGAEIVGEAEDGPVVIDRAEVGVGGVGELAVVDELRADDDVFAGLPGRALGLRRRGGGVSGLGSNKGSAGWTYVQSGVVRRSLCVGNQDCNKLAVHSKHLRWVWSLISPKSVCDSSCTW